MMKRTIALLLSCLLLCSSACAQPITLYGESQHGNESILAQEAELWYAAYHEQGLRHLFIEMPYYTAEYLNLWMQAADDALLEAVYKDWAGTASDTPAVKAFYQRIKAECPETVFHGTDVGHQYHTTGQRYLDMLAQTGQNDSQQYHFAQAAVEQGKQYYASGDQAYRENAMAQNFIDAYERIGGEAVIGLYGAAHTGLDAMNFDGSADSMAKQLRSRYGDVVASEVLLPVVEPLRTDTIELGGQTYEASYFGQQSLRGLFEGYDFREFWRLENAYDDVKDCPKTGDMLPYSNYPMPVETGQVFVIDYHMLDGTVNRMYYRSDGNLFGSGQPTTEQFMYNQ